MKYFKKEFIEENSLAMGCAQNDKNHIELNCMAVILLDGGIGNEISI